MPPLVSPDARLDRLSLLADVATRLLMDEQPEAVAPDVYGLLAAHLDLDLFLNYVVDGDALRLASSEGVPEDIRERIARLSFGEAVCGAVALQRRPVIAERVHESSDHVFGILRDLGVRAYACHPLIARHHLIGTLAFGSRTRDHFTSDEVRLMSTVANQAAVAIERGRLLAAHALEQEARRSAENTLMKALQDSEARLRTVLEILPVGVFIADEKARIVLVNRAANRIWGHPPVAKAHEDYAAYRGRWTSNGRPVAPSEWGLPRAVAGEESLDREIEIEAADGERRTIVNSAVPIRDAAGRIVGGVAADWDITERKRAEDALRRNEATLAQAGKMASLGAWHIDFSQAGDVNANPLHWSDEVYRIFGYEPGEVDVTNDLFFAHVHPDDRAHVEEHVARAIAERRPYAIEHRIVRRDGVIRVVAEHADISFTEHGEPLSMTGAVQDITERKHAEEALREADRRKNEFLATLSHELRNPLAAIRYALELLDGPAARSIGEAHPKDVIERQLRHLVHLVDDLLDITRIESNKVRLRKSHVELRTVLQQAIEAADPAIKGADHELLIDVPFDAIWLDADADRLAQVVTNLLNNAARYTTAGGRISVTARASGDQVTITVADTGIGLASDDLARVFEMFTQVGESGGGLGIGLALVRRLVEMHGGTVEARSDGPGAGSEFVVRLPRAAAPQSLAAASEPDGAEPQRHRILVVEDNADAAEMMAMLLRLGGDEVCVAADGPTALKLAATFLPDIGLFDIGLPGMSGYELAARIRRLPSLERIFLVAITGWGQEEDRTRARDAGFDAHLTKPAEPEAIERMIARSSARP
ncbi:MAG: PAS domain S-box protein [Bacteroidales bacterium]